MSDQREMPDLFGRVTLVLSQHTAFRSTVEKLRAACAAMKDKAGPPDADLLAEVVVFGREVLEHFEVEERPEYFGALVEVSPPLSERIAELKVEHHEMEDSIRTLIAAAETPVKAGEFALELGRFLDQLTAHERREAALLRDFFLGAEKDASS